MVNYRTIVVFLYVGNADGVDELNLNKYTMFFEKEIKRVTCIQTCSGRK